MNHSLAITILVLESTSNTKYNWQYRVFQPNTLKQTNQTKLRITVNITLINNYHVQDQTSLLKKAIVHVQHYRQLCPCFFLLSSPKNMKACKQYSHLI